MGLNLGGIARGAGQFLQGAGRIGGEIAQSQANFHAVQRQKQMEKQKQLMEMMRAGFQPVSQKPGQSSPGGAAPPGMLQRIARALGGAPPPQPFQPAPWHPANQAAEQRKHELEQQRAGIEGRFELEKYKEDQATGRAKGQYDHEKVLASMSETTKRFVAQLDSQFREGQNKIEWAQLQFGKDEAGAKLALERELGNRGLDIKQTQLEYDRDNGRYYITDNGGNIYVLDRTSGSVEQVHNKGTKEIDKAQRTEEILREMELLHQMGLGDKTLTGTSLGDDERLQELYTEYRSLQSGATDPQDDQEDIDAVIFDKGADAKISYGKP